MSVLAVYALGLLVIVTSHAPSSTFAATPDGQEPGSAAQYPNVSSSHIVQQSVLTRLAELEDRFQQKEREWREERESLQKCLRRLETKHYRLKKTLKERTRKEDTHAEIGQPPDSANTQQQHNIASRSDDTDSLAPVVDELSQRLSQVGADVEALKNANLQQDVQIQQAGTSTFVRWGRSVCPNSADLVYTGVAGGADYRGHGSSTSVLCLPLNPVFGSLSKSQYYAELWGAEYQTHGSSPAHNNRDPVCAVCRAPRPTTIMIPATTACGDGWVLEYSGYLMGSYPPHNGGHPFVCMDSALEDRVGSELDQEGLLMYLTFARCQGSSLPCPPYEQDKAITCAVCSK